MKIHQAVSENIFLYFGDVWWYSVIVVLVTMI